MRQFAPAQEVSAWESSSSLLIGGSFGGNVRTWAIFHKYGLRLEETTWATTASHSL